jgi:hypothetical protein
MSRKRHSPESIAKVLRQAESGTPIAELARKAGVLTKTPSTSGKRSTVRWGRRRSVR